jgi:protein TonB
MSAAKREDLRPQWLRPAALALVVAAHAGVLLLGRAQIAPPPSLDSLRVEMIAEGDSVADQTPQAEVQPQEVKPQRPPAPAPPPQAAPLAAPPPQQEAPEAPPLPIAEPKPVEKPAEEPDKPSPAQLRDTQRRKLADQRRREERRKAEAERERKAQEARQAARRGAANGARSASGMSQANFAGLVVAQLNRHKFYPAAARAAGIQGSVGVAFTIGPSGRVVSQSITRSSGNGMLDNAARVILSSIHTPPPPGGRFSTSTNINFQRR